MKRLYRRRAYCCLGRGLQWQQSNFLTAFRAFCPFAGTLVPDLVVLSTSWAVEADHGPRCPVRFTVSTSGIWIFCPMRCRCQSSPISRVHQNACGDRAIVGKAGQTTQVSLLDLSKCIV